MTTTRLSRLEKSELPLATAEAHARELERACRAAAQILADTPERHDRDLQEPLPASSIRLIRRLPRRRD
jgi:hypothetical protein